MKDGTTNGRQVGVIAVRAPISTLQGAFPVGGTVRDTSRLTVVGGLFGQIFFAILVKSNPEDESGG
jgi:hypothetical protein